MYRKKRIVNTGNVSGSFSPFAEDVRIARPMSYYVNGGVDIDGVSNRPPIPSHFDDAEGVSSGVVDIATDPRVSRLDIADFASYEATEAEKRAAKDISDVD